MNAIPPTTLPPALLLTILEKSALGLLVLDTEQRVVFWNHWLENGSGISKDQVFGRRFIEIFPDLADSRLHHAITGAVNRGLSTILSPKLNPSFLALCVGDRKEAMSQMILIKAIEPDQLGRYCLVQILDVTNTSFRDHRLREQARDLMQAKSSAEAANQTKNLFLANMSHEIRTPLNTIMGMAELMENADDLHKVRQQAKTIQNSGTALMSIMNDVLDFSRIEAGELTLEQTLFDITILLAEICDLYAGMARTRHIDFFSNLAPELPTSLLGDPNRLRQILLNLLSNAIKFTKNGEVRLQVLMTEQTAKTVHLQFIIKDTGIGISSEQMERLFKPFTQADISTTRKFGGSGLGLAITRRLVLFMGGEIHVDTILGEGTVFYVNLPFAFITEEKKHSQEITLSDEGITPLPAELKILLVEDDELNQQVIKGLLKQIGVYPDIANNGEEALVCLARQRYDLVFMDYQMPIMDGLTACQRFRAGESNTAQRTPIVALTAHALKGDRERCLEAGMDDYLTKPVRGKTLRQTILRWVPAR
ncbi:MAG: response regulator [Magnetococcales bacterium]|nr:response regulator [Magnetococcales bacterium]